jgi:ABC-type glycerol-3-phosphate transport system permease component
MTGPTKIQLLRTILLHLLLVAIGLTMVLPFVWMLLTSLKPANEIDVPNWIPSTLTWSNFPKVFEVIELFRFYWNSLFVAAWVTFLQVLTSAMAAYAFSRLRWPGRDKVFLLYLATMMLPAAFTPFGTFLLRKFMLTIPSSLDEAAAIDGAGVWQVFWNIILPLTRSGMITLTIFSFMANYGSFFWPLVMMRTTEKYTLPIGLLFFDSSRGQATHLLMAAVTLTILPMIAAFVFLQKQMISGI